MHQDYSKQKYILATGNPQKSGTKDVRT